MKIREGEIRGEQKRNETGRQRGKDRNVFNKAKQISMEFPGKFI